MKKQNKVMVGALALLVMGTSSLAYFTDRAESTFTGQAGTLCLTHVDSQSDLLNMAPGDTRDLSFEYKNEGSLSMDTRVTYMLSYELEDGKAGTTEGKVVTLLDGDKELVTKSFGAGVAKVTADEATIQGTKDKTGVATLKKNLKLKLHEEVKNDFQDATFHIDIVVEGKQNKNDAQWEEINTQKITVRADELDVVHQSACNVTDGEDGEEVDFVQRFAITDGVAEVLTPEDDKLTVTLKWAMDEGDNRSKVLLENGTVEDVEKLDLSALDLEEMAGAEVISAHLTNANFDDWSVSGGLFFEFSDLEEAIENGDILFTFDELPEPGDEEE